MEQGSKVICLQLDKIGDGELTVLCLGAHCDDIEIGCGGTILKWVQERPGTRFHWLVFSSTESRKAEATKSAERFLEGAKDPTVSVLNFQDGFFPYHGERIKSHFETLKPLNPDVILTHTRADAHQDHRLVNELTWNTFRDHLILEYEIPKYDGDLSRTNVYVPLEDGVFREKTRILEEVFPSQAAKPWYSADTFLSLMRLRGVECRAPSGYAEAFYCHKLVLR